MLPGKEIELLSATLHPGMDRASDGAIQNLTVRNAAHSIHSQTQKEGQPFFEDAFATPASRVNQNRSMFDAIPILRIDYFLAAYRFHRPS